MIVCFDIGGSAIKAELIREAREVLGVEALRKPLDLVMQYSVEQKIIPRAFAVDELFDDVAKKLA